MKKLIIAIGVFSISTYGFLNYFKKTPKEGEIQKIGHHLDGVNTSSVDWKAKDKTYWKKNLTPLQYHVTREAGTERAFTGYLWDHKEAGHYHCSNCGQKLFSSKTKFKSGTGWPSFYDVTSKENVGLKEDRSFGMSRVEVVCSRCDAHLGHVFDDGPKPTGLRYCINSVSLVFKK